MAYAGRKLGVPVSVVVPNSSTARARELLALEGAQVTVHGDSWQEANTLAQSLLGPNDAFIHPFMALGAAGAITASAHLATERFATLASAAGTREEAEALLPLVLALFAEPNPAVIQALLYVQGRIATPAVRLPHMAASRSGTERALAALQAL